MQTKPLSLVLAALAAAVAADHAEHFHIGDYWGDDYYDGSLPGVVNDIPACALPCLTAKAAAWGCQPTDFHCLCNHGVGIAAEVALCLPNACSTISESGRLGTVSCSPGTSVSNAAAPLPGTGPAATLLTGVCSIERRAVRALHPLGARAAVHRSRGGDEHDGGAPRFGEWFGGRFGDGPCCNSYGSGRGGLDAVVDGFTA